MSGMNIGNKTSFSAAAVPAIINNNQNNSNIMNNNIMNRQNYNIYNTKHFQNIIEDMTNNRINFQNNSNIMNNNLNNKIKNNNIESVLKANKNSENSIDI